MSAAALAELERERDRIGPDAAARKLAALRVLARARLATAAQVRRLHEALCFLRAYPDDALVLAQVESMLARFDRRGDLHANRDALAHSGIAGTTIWFPFFWPTACWLARSWPRLLAFDRNDREAEKSLAKAASLLATPIEAAALRELKLSGYATIDRLRPRGRTDAAFLIERVAAMAGDSFTREAFYDAINPSCELAPTADTPARGREKFGPAPIAFRAAPLRGDRPDLRRELHKPPRSVQRLSARHGAQLADLARGAMATRKRDLDAFAYGNARDAWLVDDGDGLSFALLGMIPERRAPIAAIYGGLMLASGVPTGYVQADLVGRTAALSFNIFDTFRGGQAAFVFARLLAALREVFGIDAFSLDSYQLGTGNEEGIASGAWWFYFKLGFRPRARAAIALARAELAQRRADPLHRSSVQTLRQLAAHPLFFDFDSRRRTALPPLAAIGLRAARLIAARSDDRESALRAICAEAATALGPRSLSALNAAEQRALMNLAPLIVAAGATRWPRRQRRVLAQFVRAKAATSERDYVRLLASPHGRKLLASAGRRN